MPLVTELSSQAELWAFIQAQSEFILNIQEDAKRHAQFAHTDALTVNRAMAVQANQLGCAHNDIDRLQAELAQAKAEIATMQAELSALRPSVSPEVEAEVSSQWREMWAATAEDEGRPERCARCGEQMDAAFGMVFGLADMSPIELALAQSILTNKPKHARMYAYINPAALAKHARRGGRRLHASRWLGGVAHRELMALAKAERLYLTHRELAKLRAYAADWDASAEQMLNDSIPW